MPAVMISELLGVFAAVSVALGVALIIQLDGTMAHSGSLATASVSRANAHGLRAQRRHEHKANPVLFLLGSVLILLVIATMA